MTGMTPTGQMISVSCLQLDAASPTDLDDRIQAGLDLVTDRESDDLVVLPELWATGYFNFDRYAPTAQGLHGPIVSALGKVAASSQTYVAGASIVESDGEGPLFNTSLLVAPDGELKATYRKVNLFGYKSREPDLVQPGQLSDAAPVETEIGTLGMMICYDLRFPEVAAHLAHQGAELLVLCAAWPSPRREHWVVSARARAIETQSFLLACNSAGTDNGVTLAGSSMIVAPWGDVFASADDGAAVVAAQLDLGELRRYREEVPLLSDRLAKPICGCTISGSAFSRREPGEQLECVLPRGRL